MKELADAIKTLGWCIFWGLLMHGCLGDNTQRIKFTDSNNETYTVGVLK